MHLAIVLVVAIILCFTYSKLFPKKHASVAKLPSPPKHPIFGHLPFLLDSDNLVHYLEHWASELGELYQFDLPFTTAVVVSSPVEIIKILKSRPSHFQKPESFQRVFHEIGLKGLLTVDGDEWRHSRRLISPAFTASKLKFMNDNVIKHALEFRRDLLKVSERQKELVRKPFKPSELDDCSSLFGKMTFSVVLQIAFGTVGNLMSPDYSRKSKIAFQCLNERLDRVLPLHKIYRTERDVILDEVFDEMDAFTDELIVEYRRGNERFAGTVFETLMIAHEEDKNDDFKLFKGNLKTVLLAGFETTSNSIQSMLRLLIDNPLVFRKAQIEVDQVLGPNPTEQDYYSHPVEDFPYCQNVVKEVVRIYSVLNYAYYESMQPVEVGGVTFPKGTEFFVMLRSGLFRDNYPTPNPMDFNPDRWVGLDEKTYKLQTSISLGFGAGPRICPGKNLAQVEMVYALAYAISAFDLKLFPRLPSSPSPVEVASATTFHKNFFPMFLERIAH